VPQSTLTTVPHGQKRQRLDKGETDRGESFGFWFNYFTEPWKVLVADIVVASQSQTEITTNTEVAIRLTFDGLGNSSELVNVMDDNSAANVLQSLQQGILSRVITMGDDGTWPALGRCFHMPTLSSDTAVSEASQTPCDSNLRPEHRVRHSVGAPNHQAVITASTQSSQRTDNYNSHALSSRVEQEGRSLRTTLFILLIIH
jgi:hypothetical protein